MLQHLRAHFQQPTLCPYCGDGNIEGDGVEINSDMAEQRVQCVACGRQWRDRYRLFAITDDQGQAHEQETLAEVIVLGPVVPSAALAVHPEIGGVAQVPASPPVVARGASPGEMEDRDLRQRDILPPPRLAQCAVTVIGVGAIGRQVALQLAAIGVSRLQLLDPQSVETVNLAPQGYLETDLGQPKAEATGRLCTQINADVQLELLSQRFRRSQAVHDLVFMCVDAIETRRLIWEAVKDRTRFFCDGRMSAEVVRVLCAADPAGHDHYRQTLFPANEAYRGACTARSTIFTANIAAGLMLEQFARWLRGLPVDADLTLNLLSSELMLANCKLG